MAARIAMIAMTTNNSMSVKPLLLMTSSLADLVRMEPVLCGHLFALNPPILPPPRHNLPQAHTESCKHLPGGSAPELRGLQAEGSYREY